MAASNVNNIYKSDAIPFTRETRDMNYVINGIVNTTLHGREYPVEQRYGTHEMSYFCIAYNITKTGATKQANRIKSRYKKYENIPGIENYMRKILQEQWPGFPGDNPRMDDLLANYAKQASVQKNNSQAQSKNKYSQPQSSYSQPQRSKDSFDIDNSPVNVGVCSVIGIAVILIVISTLKGCGFYEIVGPLLMAALIIGILYPLYLFKKNRLWKHLGRLFSGLILFGIASSFTSKWWIFVIFWVAAICVWEDTKK